MPPSFQSFRQRLFRLTLPKQGLFYVRILGLILPACEDFSAKNHWQSITVLRKVYLLLQEWLSKGPLSSETQRQLLESLEGLDLDRDSCSQIGASLVEFADFLGIAAIHLLSGQQPADRLEDIDMYLKRAICFAKYRVSEPETGIGEGFYQEIGTDERYLAALEDINAALTEAEGGEPAAKSSKWSYEFFGIVLDR